MDNVFETAFFNVADLAREGVWLLECRPAFHYPQFPVAQAILPQEIKAESLFIRIELSHLICGSLLERKVNALSYSLQISILEKVQVAGLLFCIVVEFYGVSLCKHVQLKQFVCAKLGR